MDPHDPHSSSSGTSHPQHPHHQAVHPVAGNHDQGHFFPASAPPMVWHPHPHSIPHTVADANILSALTYMLGNLHDRMIECFSKLESNHTKLQSSVDSLSSELTEVKEQSHVEMKKIGQWVDAAHRQQAKAIGRVFEKVSKLESRIGVGKDRRMEGDAASVAGSSSGSTGSSVESNTVLERIKNVEYVMLELLEKANDPDAAKPPIVRHEIGTSPHIKPKEYNDAAIETLQLDRIDIGVETVLPVMVNAGTDSCFLEIMENAIDAETETTSELPSYLHRGTSLPPFASLDIPTDAILPFLAMNSDPMEFNALEANEESHSAIHSLGSSSQGEAFMSASGSVRALQSSVGTPSPHPQSRNSTPRPLQQDFDESSSTASTSNVAGPSQTRQLSPSSLQDLERSLTPPSSPNTTGPSQIDRSTTPSPPAHPSTPINRLQKLRAQSETLSPLSDLSTSGTSSPGISSVMEVEAAVWAEPVAIASSSNRTSNPTRSRKRRRTTTGSSGPSKRAKGKSRKVVPDSDEELDSVCHWPEKLSLKKGSIQKDFVQCDGCDSWYHYECVGLTADDDRLKPGAEFLCPPCIVHQRFYDYNRVVPTVRDDYCARPDCEHPNFLGAGEYFIQRVIGRQPHISDDSDGPSEFLWLVKWDDYNTVDSTWNFENDMSNAQRHIKKFEEDAKEQDLDLSDPNSTILLWEAVEAGFR